MLTLIHPPQANVIPPRCVRYGLLVPLSPPQRPTSPDPTTGGAPAAALSPCPRRTRPTNAFLTIPQTAEELATSQAQVLAPVKRGDLPAIKLGGRGQWRIESAKPETFIEQTYEETARGLGGGAIPPPAERSVPWRGGFEGRRRAVLN